MNLPESSGMIHLRSAFGVARTVQRLETLLQQKAVKVFCSIDHSGEAAEVGLAMRPTRLLIFGNPIAGTRFMMDSPTIAIDLPLKALVWEDPEGIVWLSFNSAEYLRKRHGLIRETAPLEAPENLFHMAVDDEVEIG